MLEPKSANTLQCNHLSNILVAPEWGLIGAKVCWRGEESQPECIRVWSRDEPMPLATGRCWFDVNQQPTGGPNSIILLRGCPGFGMALSSKTFF